MLEVVGVLTHDVLPCHVTREAAITDQLFHAPRSSQAVAYNGGVPPLLARRFGFDLSTLQDGSSHDQFHAGCAQVLQDRLPVAVLVDFDLVLVELRREVSGERHQSTLVRLRVLVLLVVDRQHDLLGVLEAPGQPLACILLLLDDLVGQAAGLGAVFGLQRLAAVLHHLRLSCNRLRIECSLRPAQRLLVAVLVDAARRPLVLGGRGLDLLGFNRTGLAGVLAEYLPSYLPGPTIGLNEHTHLVARAFNGIVLGVKPDSPLLVQAAIVRPAHFMVNMRARILPAWIHTLVPVGIQQNLEALGAAVTHDDAVFKTLRLGVPAHLVRLPVVPRADDAVLLGACPHLRCLGLQGLLPQVVCTHDLAPVIALDL
mmetsp:Transcript_16965/g.35438  ORF Transcript_16965/g.35438 Transcript_16965/m.35438 type:complete len:370 (-) Transcript_16965:113-1222(-)